ncbi:hypothetical protein GE061_006515 [Apolygus lucorum]|uniref:Uncharacterized protein n=1 Tax=Apolygus lucorum TaxID=248454 RepID=A0A6A4J0T4_APOLU|nr:hypothetical protein GE061_006515 [Apolygus lucorum]
MAQQPSPITWLLMRWEVPVRRIREETEDLFSEIFKIYGYSGMEEWTLNLVPPRVSRSPYLGLYLNYEGTEPTFTTFQLVILNGSMGNCIVQSFKDASFQFKNSRIGSAKFAIAEDVFDPKNGFVRECDGIIGILLRMRTIREGFEEMLEEGARRGAQWEVIPNYAPAIEDDSDDEDDEEDSSDDEDDEVTISDDGNDGPGITQTQTVETEVTISDDGNDGPGITQTQTVETVVEISDDEDETPMAASIRRARSHNRIQDHNHKLQQHFSNVHQKCNSLQYRRGRRFHNNVVHQHAKAYLNTTLLNLVFQ